MVDKSFISGFSRQRIDALLLARLINRAGKRFGFIRSIHRLLSYRRYKGGFFHNRPNRYIRHGKDIYVLPNLPPLNRVEFLDYILDDIEALGSHEKLPLAFALVSVSSRCPYKCKYCYAEEDLRQNEILPIDILIKTINGLIECGIENIMLTGGEPMMRHEELKKILDACYDNRTGFWLVSSGWNMDKEKLIDLRARGLRGVMISLDSADKTECARFKGRSDAFKTAVSAIQNAKKAGLIASVDCVLDYNLLKRKEFDDFVTFAGNLGVHFINFFVPRPINNKNGQKLNLFTGEQLKKVDKLIHNARRSKKYRDKPLVYSPDVWEAVRGCVGGKAFIYINPQGDVTSCPFLKNVKGSVLKDDIRKIIKDVQEEGSQEPCIVNKLFAESFKK